MNSIELKNILIEEIGILPYADKKIIDEAATIPDEIFEKLQKKTQKRKKLTSIITIIFTVLILTSLFLSFWFKEGNFYFVLFASVLFIQILQIHYNSDFKDYSKKQLIFKLFKIIKSKENSSKTDS